MGLCFYTGSGKSPETLWSWLHCLLAVWLNPSKSSLNFPHWMIVSVNVSLTYCLGSSSELPHNKELVESPTLQMKKQRLWEILLMVSLGHTASDRTLTLNSPFFSMGSGKIRISGLPFKVDTKVRVSKIHLLGTTVCQPCFMMWMAP